MTTKEFRKRLWELTFLCIVWTLGWYFARYDLVATWTYGVSIIFYVVFSILIFLFAKRLLAKDRRHSFNGIVSISFLIKLVVSIAIVWSIEAYLKPISNTHIFHYLVMYIVYTVFEVWFLTKLSYS